MNYILSNHPNLRVYIEIGNSMKIYRFFRFEPTSVSRCCAAVARSRAVKPRMNHNFPDICVLSDECRPLLISHSVHKVVACQHCVCSSCSRTFPKRYLWECKHAKMVIRVSLKFNLYYYEMLRWKNNFNIDVIIKNELHNVN